MIYQVNFFLFFFGCYLCIKGLLKDERNFLVVVERIKSIVIRKLQLYKRVYVRNVIYDEVLVGFIEIMLSKFEE